LKDKMEISVVIISAKPRILTELRSCPVPYELIVDRSQGISCARNNGARKAKNDLIVFVDDDVRLDPKVWRYALATRAGEMALPLIDFYGREHGPYANSRFIAVHKADFWRLGGFDESLRIVGEDRDFYYRALKAGLKIRPIPFSLIRHIPHPTRENSNVHIAIGGIRDRAKVFADHGVQHPELFALDFTPRIQALRAKHLLLETVFLLWFIMKKPFSGVSNL
jgi:glycosyltransferase involved in cell wall biosynthesis